MSSHHTLRHVLAWLAIVLVFATHVPFGWAQDSPPRPNVLWITCEDISANLGCFGDSYAVTPNLDRFAEQGIRYLNAFATIGVCAPARSTIITGMYPPSIGTQYMRCQGTPPTRVRCYPEYLREAGYYCTNNSKTDYNFKHPKNAWDESSRNAHWRKRDDGQPFFSIFNFTSCHESQIRLGETQYQNRTRDFTAKERHDPAKAPVPPYHPDTPEVRRDWARYADMITHMDRQVGKLLRDLEQDGLAEDTIVFFYSDHGAGMPRSKRWLFDSSIRVPFMVRFPERFRHLAPGKPGSTTDRLISFVDLAPTLLSLTGIQVPEHLQGHAFLGKQAAAPRRYIYGFRDRMDERYDMVRCVRDARFKYLRNFMPHVPYAQHISYMYQMPTMRVWQQLADEGELVGAQRHFFAIPKPVEELYDTSADPHEVKNLAGDPQYREVLDRLRKELRRWQGEIVDLGLLPEGELRSRFAGTPEYEAVRQHPERYPLERLLAAADLANRIDPRSLPELIRLLRNEDAGIRYWGALGCVALGEKAAPAEEALREALGDISPNVAIAAADALSHLGKDDVAVPALARLLGHENSWARLHAANVLDGLDERARPALDAMKRANSDDNKYVKRVIAKALQSFE